MLQYSGGQTECSDQARLRAFAKQFMWFDYSLACNDRVIPLTLSPAEFQVLASVEGA
jgi:hypothetical protein